MSSLGMNGEVGYDGFNESNESNGSDFATLEAQVAAPSPIVDNYAEDSHESGITIELSSPEGLRRAKEIFVANSRLEGDLGDEDCEAIQAVHPDDIANIAREQNIPPDALREYVDRNLEAYHQRHPENAKKEPDNSENINTATLNVMESFRARIDALRERRNHESEQSTENMRLQAENERLTLENENLRNMLEEALSSNGV
ncbi:MAG: hypothetical protein WCO23_00055 [bacterium]